MKRNTLNFLIDLVSAIVLLGITATGLIVRFVLPPGSGRGWLPRSAMGRSLHEPCLAHAPQPVKRN